VKDEHALGDLLPVRKFPGDAAGVAHARSAAIAVVRAGSPKVTRIWAARRLERWLD